MLPVVPQPWSPAQATERIRAIAGRTQFVLSLTQHAKDQITERDLLVGDVLYLLKNGFVYDNGIPSTRQGFFKYQIECRTPNSGNRDVRVIGIPDWAANEIKIVTVMWRDEAFTSR